MYRSNIIRVENNNRRHYDTTVIPKKLKLFFILVQIFLCLDFGFIEYKTQKKKILLKLGSVFVSLCFGIFIISQLLKIGDNYYITWGLKFFIEYYLYILILIFTPEDGTFYIYQIRLQQFDSKIEVQTSSFNLANKLIFYFFLLCLFDIGNIWLHYFYSQDYELQLHIQVIFYIPSLTYSLPFIIFFFVYLSTYYRLKQLKILVENRNCSILSALQHYKFLIDSMDKVMKSFKYIYIVCLILNIPAIMASVYDLLKSIHKESEITMGMLVPYFVIFTLITVRAAPGVAATWLAQEPMRIKLVLNKRIIEEKDRCQILAMEMCARYIDARPFKFNMLLIIPMDATLLVIVLDFCISYLIIIVQMTHIV